MREALEDKKYTVVGGDANFISKLKLLFPKWKFFSDRLCTNKNNDILFGSEVILFVAKHSAHSSFAKVAKQSRTHDIPLVYLNTMNIDKIVSTLYGNLSKPASEYDQSQI